MIAVDANILLYAYDAAAPQHARARAWLEATFSTEPVIGLPLVTILAFVRIATDHRVREGPMRSIEAAEIVSAWLERGNVSVLEPGPRHWSIFSATLLDTGLSGPRATDVHLAALAIEHGAILHTNDRDFRRFPALSVRFPLFD